MADIAELREQISNLEQRLQLLRGQINTIEDQQEAAANAGNKLYAELVALGKNPEQDPDYLRLRNEATALNSELSTALSQFSQLRNELSIAQADLQAQQRAQASSTARSDAAVAGGSSAGQIANEDAAAEGRPQTTEVIRPDGRVTAPPENPGGSNAASPTTVSTQTTDINTDPPVKSLNETQAITSQSSQSFPITVEDRSPQTVFSGGAGAAKDDASAPNQTVQTVERTFGEIVTPQPNVLDKYYSYTYNVELQLLRPAEYKELLQTKRPIVNGGLLIRSGGVPPSPGGSVSVTVGGQTATVQTRNPFFSLDYYIDSLELSNLVTGKGTGSSNQNTKIKMTIIEPNGITLIENIAKAVEQFCGIKNYAASIYCLTVTFYGYDENGVLQRAQNSDVNSSTDPYAVVTKYIPFIIDNISFSVGNNLTTYTLTGVPTGQDIGSGQARGSVPYNIEVSGSTVGQVLGGDQGVTTKSSTASDETLGKQFQTNTNQSILNTLQTTGGPSKNSPPKADAATNQNTGTIVGGLMGALNEFQRKLVKDGIFQIADEYSIEFVDEEIRGARVKPILNSAYSNTPMTNPDNARSALSETQSMNPNQRIVGITAGMPIIQAIDLVIRNSSFIEQQQIRRVSEVTGDVVNESRNAKAFSWFKISIVSEQKNYDLKRNDYAYKIKFVVSLYQVKGLDSPWFPTGNFTGVHKSYPYWFTGKNTQVLDYNINYNHTYRTTLSTADSKPNTGTSDLQKIRKYWYAPRSGQSSQQAENGKNEPAANAAEFLYNQGDLGNSKIRIIGDPAWIMQGEIFAGVDSRAFIYSPYLPDGTINYDAGEILFEIVWIRNADYDLDSGLMAPQLDSKSYRQTSKQSTVYKATQVTSYFQQGKFEQQLEGTLYIFDIPNTTQQAKQDVNTAKDIDQTKSDINQALQLRYPVNNSVADASNRAAAATDTLSDPSQNYSSSAPGADRFSGQANTDTQTGQNNLGNGQLTAPAILPAAPAAPPSSDGFISGPVLAFPGVQTNITTPGENLNVAPSPSLPGIQTNIAVAGENLNTTPPATLPGVQWTIVPTTDRQLMTRET